MSSPGRRGARSKLARWLLVIAVWCLVVGGMAPARPTTAQSTARTATVAHSSDGVLLRAEPDFGAAVLTILSTGTLVDLRTDTVDTIYDPDGITRWWPVRAGDQEGWIAGFYLELDGVATTDTSDGSITVGDEVPVEAEMTADAQLGGDAAMVNSPDGVHLRAEPEAGAASLMSVVDGEIVGLRITEVDTVWSGGTRWWPVEVGAVAGWIAGDYLAPADLPSDEAVTGVDPGFAIGDYVAAVTDSGGGVNMRADPAPEAERVGYIPEADVVQILDGPFWDPAGNVWYLVSDGEVSGFSDASLFAIAEQPVADNAAPAEPDRSDPADDVARVPEAGVATGTIISPVGGSYTLTQTFGCSIYWFEPYEAAYGCNYHNGIDLANNAYTPLVAADSGVVEYAGWCDCGLGFYVKIDHGNGIKTVYGHMAEQPWVAAGQAVSQGEAIGPMGSTGNSTGPHVHFMIELNGTTVDPAAYLAL